MSIRLAFLPVKMPLSPDQLLRLKNSSWNEVISAWKAKEMREGFWDAHMQERGYTDWEDYRFGPRGSLIRYHFSLLDLEDLEWGVYDFLDRKAAYPQVHSGPFKAWKKTPVGELPPRFAEIDSAKNSNVLLARNRLLNGDLCFAIGLYEEERGVLALVDGHHTLSALNLIVQEGLEPPVLDLRMAKIPVEKKELFYRIITWELEPIPL